MSALLAKDLRLSLDTLLPWGLIVGGFAAIAAALTRVPETVMPEVIGRMSIADILFVVAIVVGGSAAAIGAWVAAAVAQGDRIHGAEHLMMALPVSPWRRGSSKLLAVALGAAIPALVSTGSAAASIALSGRTDVAGDDLWRWAVATSGASFVGAGLGLGVAPLVHGPFRVVFIALLLGLFGGLAGLLASWVTFDHVPFGVLEFARHQLKGTSKPSLGHPFDVSRNVAAVVSAITGVGAIALVAALAGTLSLARPRRRRGLLAVLGVGLAVSFAAGAAATIVWVDRDPAIRRSVQWAQWRFSRMNDAELIQLVTATYVSPRSGTSPVFDALISLVPNEVQGRLGRLDPADRADHPLMKAAMALQDNSTESQAVRTVSFLPPGPESLERSLDAMRRHPTLRRWFLTRLILNSGFAAEFYSLGPSAGDDSTRRFDDLAKRTLRALQERYPAQRDAIQALLDEMDASGEQ
ncbi:MAG: hypothetical protein U0575_14135 [Phycisphaerales bacterium]